MVTKKQILNLISEAITNNSSTNAEDLSIILKKYFQSVYIVGDKTKEIELTVVNNYDKLKNILQQNNWFISKIDGSKFSGGKINGKYFIIKPKIGTKADNVPSILYHISPSINDSNIKTNGLIPSSKAKTEQHPERVYLADSIELIMSFIKKLSWYSDEKDYTVWEVKTNNLNIPFYIDDEIFKGGYYVTNVIPPQNLKVVKRLNLNDLVNESISLKKEKNDFYEKYIIKKDGKEIGLIEADRNGNRMEIISISILPEFRAKGYGTMALKQFKKNCSCSEITADCVSQESFFTFIKAFGEPSYFGNIFHEFTNYEKVRDYLPLKATEDSEGGIIPGSDSAVFVSYLF